MRRKKDWHPLLGRRTLKYYVVDDGEWYPVGAAMICCDCCLAHDLKWRLVDFDRRRNTITIEQQAYRNRRKTAALRRTRRKAMRRRLGL